MNDPLRELPPEDAKAAEVAARRVRELRKAGRDDVTLADVLGEMGAMPGSPGAADPEAPTRGIPFGRYQLVEELGRGGMGVVWKAWDTQLHRTVALKQVLDAGGMTPDAMERFVREARAAARLAHPSIVAVHDVGVIEGRHYFTADFVEGESLEKVAKPLRPRRAAELVRDVALALEHAHQQGIVHRDVKPANILIDAEGRPKVTDFGLAKDLGGRGSAGLTVPGAVMGTPSYMSPEQAEGRNEEIGPASDQFSLGIILYEILSGERPFQGSSVVRILASICEDDPAPLSSLVPKLDPGLERICSRALAKRPGDRYRRIGDLAAALERFLEGRAQRESTSNLRRPSTGSMAVARRSTGAMRAVSPAGGTRTIAVACAIGATLALVIILVALATRGGGSTSVRDEAREPEPGAAPPPAEEMLDEARLPLERARRLLYQRDSDRDEVRRLATAAREALAGSADSALELQLLGDAWEIEGHPDLAEESWRRAVEVDPGLPGPRLALARHLVARAWLVENVDSAEGAPIPAEARAALADASALLGAALPNSVSLDEVEADLGRALAAYARGDREAAARLAVEATSRLGAREGVEELHLVAGMAAPSHAGRSSEFDQAIAIRPNFPLALVYRAVSRFYLGQVDPAFSDCEQALWYDPRCAPARTLLGKACYSRGDFERAEREFAEVVRLRPEDGGAHNNLGAVRYRRGDVRGALESYDAAIRHSSGNAVAFLNRALARRDSGNLAGALADHDRAIELDPRLRGVHAERGRTRAAGGDQAGAIRDYDVALAQVPDDLRTLNDRAAVRKALGQFDLALQDLDRAIELDPAYLEALVNRGDARIMKGDLDGAIADLEKALSVAPPNWSFRSTIEALLAQARRRRGGD